MGGWHPGSALGVQQRRRTTHPHALTCSKHRPTRKECIQPRVHIRSPACCTSSCCCLEPLPAAACWLLAACFLHSEQAPPTSVGARRTPKAAASCLQACSSTRTVHGVHVKARERGCGGLATLRDVRAGTLATENERDTTGQTLGGQGICNVQCACSKHSAKLCKTRRKRCAGCTQGARHRGQGHNRPTCEEWDGQRTVDRGRANTSTLALPKGAAATQPSHSKATNTLW